jgi:hypothetical protein
LLTETRRFDSEFLYAGKQYQVDAPLPLEVVTAVFEEPAEHRHQDATLDEQNDRGLTLAAVRLVVKRGLQTPGRGIAEDFGEEQRVGLAHVSGTTKQPFDISEQLRIVERAGGALRQELTTQALADPLLQVRHDGVRVDVSCQNCRAPPGGPRWSPSWWPRRGPSV